MTWISFFSGIYFFIFGPLSLLLYFLRSPVYFYHFSVNNKKVLMDTGKPFGPPGGFVFDWGCCWVFFLEESQRLGAKQIQTNLHAIWHVESIKALQTIGLWVWTSGHGPPTQLPNCESVLLNWLRASPGYQLQIYFQPPIEQTKKKK